MSISALSSMAHNPALFAQTSAASSRPSTRGTDADGDSDGSKPGTTDQVQRNVTATSGTVGTIVNTTA